MGTASPCSSDAGQEEQLETIVQRSNAWSLPYRGSLETWDFRQQKGAFSTRISEFTEIYSALPVKRNKLQVLRKISEPPVLDHALTPREKGTWQLSDTFLQSSANHAVTRGLLTTDPDPGCCRDTTEASLRPWTITPCCSSKWQITTLPKESWNKSRGTRVLGARVKDTGPQASSYLHGTQRKPWSYQRLPGTPTIHIGQNTHSTTC